MRMFAVSFTDEIHTIVYLQRQLKGKSNSFVKKESKFTGYPGKKLILRYNKILSRLLSG
jgi:hypothetical protein